MNLYNIKYTFDGNEGAATVAALTPNKAGIILKSLGKFNGAKGKYYITSITEVGCTNSEEGLISETCNTPLVIRESYNVNNFDINSLSKEDIEVLKLKLNEDTGTLYVDRIGSCNAKILRSKENLGYKVFTTSPAHPEGDIGTTPHEEGHLYVVSMDTSGKLFFKDYGRPTKFRYVESESKKVDLKTFFLRDKRSTYLGYNYKKSPYKTLGIFALIVARRHKAYKDRWIRGTSYDKIAPRNRRALLKLIKCVHSEPLRRNPKTIYVDSLTYNKLISSSTFFSRFCKNLEYYPSTNFRSGTIPYSQDNKMRKIVLELTEASRARLIPQKRDIYRAKQKSGIIQRCILYNTI